ncbi:hypothetical protein [Accumulibacter sp.]|nr:hypothetical protein [Accumulibacter sp.]
MSDRAIAALQAILDEVSGLRPPFSADSYLPAHDPRRQDSYR